MDGAYVEADSVTIVADLGRVGIIRSFRYDAARQEDVLGPLICLNVTGRPPDEDYAIAFLTAAQAREVAAALLAHAAAVEEEC
jgi:hypothetical protein